MPDLFRISYYLAKSLLRPYWKITKIRNFQEKRLRSVIKHAYETVPFYHQKFKEAGISPGDINNLEDLSKIPVITKDEIRSNEKTQLISNQSSMDNLKIQRTSGSTGKPFTLFLNQKEDSWRKAIYLRANISCGQRLRDKWVVITAPHHFSDTSNIQRRLGFLAQTCIPVFTNIDHQINIIKNVSPEILDGYSGALHLLARKIDEKGGVGINPKLIFGTAELISDRSQKYIEKIFDAPYYDQFGCSEVDRTAWQCPEKMGYHMDVDSVITQFVDEEGNDVAPGERGNIVYTSLFNYSMPFIRYSVGDLGVPSDEVCSCGRTLPLMKVVEGRKDSVIILPNGDILSPRVFSIAMGMFEHYSMIDQFKIVQEKVDLFNIFIKKQDKSIKDEVFKNYLLSHLRKTISKSLMDVDIRIDFVEDIPREKTGKRRSIISKVRI